MQFRLRSLLLLMLPIAVFCAALRDASRAWDSGIVIFTVSAIGAAIIAGRFDRRSRGPFWWAFSLFAAGYFSIVAITDNHLPKYDSEHAKLISLLMPEHLDRRLLEILHPTASYPPGNPFLEPTTSASAVSAGPDNAAEPTPEDATLADPELGSRFMRISHCLWSLILGALGGCVAQQLYLRCHPKIEQKIQQHPPLQRALKPARVVSLVRWTAPLAAFAGMAAFALINATPAWAMIAATATVGATMAAILAATFFADARRCPASGFAICCGLYLLFCSRGETLNADGPGMSSYVDAAATTQALYHLHDRFFPDTSVRLVPLDEDGYGPIDLRGVEAMQNVPDAESTVPDHVSVTGQPTYLSQVIRCWIGQGDDLSRAHRFVIIGQCLWAVAFGWIGALFARVLADKSQC